MAFPTTGVLDSFNRANEGPPPSASWTTGINGGAAGLKVSSNTCVPDAANGTGWWNVNTFGPDCETYATLTVFGADVSALYWRIANPGANYDGYEIVVFSGAPSSNIRRVDSGTATQLGATITAALADGDQLGMEAVGSTHSYYINGAFVDSRSDATYNAAGFIGLRLKDAPTTVADGFGGGTIVTSLVSDTPFPPAGRGASW